MISTTRILGFICMWAACDKNFPYPKETGNIPSSTPPVIETKSGRISGYYMSSINSRIIGAYEGIHYAEDPVGNLRFRDPVPKKRWNGTVFANKRITCIQMDPSKFYRVVGQEDCLVLNVYIPLDRNADVSNLPVLVWIHGGAFHWGSGSHYGPSYLLDYNVILVTINYRLGPLGFLSSRDSNIRGNFGLKDQAMAIRWIKDNVHNFGGNPEQITIAGQSAGAASVHLHMMSPLSKGSFQRAISLSGSALAFWAVPPNQPVLASQLVKSLGCSSPGEGHTVADCLRRRPARLIVSKQYDLFEVLENPTILFGPVVEPNYPRAFLIDSPIEMYRKRKVADIPWMTGIVKDEGDLYTLVNYLTPLAIRRLVRNLDENIPVMLSYNRSSTQATLSIKTFYFGKSPKISFSGFEFLEAISQMIGDRYFYVPFHRTLQMHTRSMESPLYGYHFTFNGKHSISEKLHLNAEDWGVMHQDELQYMFNCSSFYYPLKTGTKDYFLSRYFTDLILKFATTGRPEVFRNQNGSHRARWKPYSFSHPELLEINLNEIGMTEEPNNFRTKFWKSIKNIY